VGNLSTKNTTSRINCHVNNCQHTKNLIFSGLQVLPVASALINFEAGYCTVATSYGTKETGLKSNSKPVKKGSFAFRKNKWFGVEQSAI